MLTQSSSKICTTHIQTCIHSHQLAAGLGGGGWVGLVLTPLGCKQNTVLSKLWSGLSTYRRVKPNLTISECLLPVDWRQSYPAQGLAMLLPVDWSQLYPAEGIFMAILLPVALSQIRRMKPNLPSWGSGHSAPCRLEPKQPHADWSGHSAPSK